MTGTDNDGRDRSGRAAGRPRTPGQPRMVGIDARSRSASLVSDMHSARSCLAETATRLDRSGALYPASYLRSACGNVDRAIEAMCVIAERERLGEPGRGDPAIERLTTLAGFQTGVALRRLDCGTLGERGRLDRDGGMVVDAGADAPVAVADAPDLGWDLLRSSEATALATGDVAAGLLVRALSRASWLHLRSRSRWSASRSGAALLVRMLRSGRAAPDLADPADGGTIDLRVSELIEALGWRRHNPAGRIEGDPASRGPDTLH